MLIGNLRQSSGTRRADLDPMKSSKVFAQHGARMPWHHGAVLHSIHETAFEGMKTPDHRVAKRGSRRGAVAYPPSFFIGYRMSLEGSLGRPLLLRPQIASQIYLDELQQDL